MCGDDGEEEMAGAEAAKKVLRAVRAASLAVNLGFVPSLVVGLLPPDRLIGVAGSVALARGSRLDRKSCRTRSMSLENLRCLIRIPHALAGQFCWDVDWTLSSGLASYGPQ